MDAEILDLLTPEAPPLEQLNELSQLIHRVVGLEDAIEKAETTLLSQQQELRGLVTKDLPDMLSQAGVSDFKTVDGLKVETRPYCSGSLPKDQPARQFAFSWLDSIGAGALIKAQLSMALERGQRVDPIISNAIDRCREILDGVGLRLDEKLDVHPQSLGALVRERLKAGQEVPESDLGIEVGRIARVIRP